MRETAVETRQLAALMAERSAVIFLSRQAVSQRVVQGVRGGGGGCSVKVN